MLPTKDFFADYALSLRNLEQREQTQPGPFCPGIASGFFEAGWELCYAAPPCRRESPLDFPHARRCASRMKRPPGEPCQRSRQWIQKKGRECSNTPRPAGQSPDGIIASARHDQVFAPARVRTSCRGRLLSTFHHVDKQSHDDAGHNLRGHVQQELHHRQSPPYGGTAPRILYHALSAGRKTKKPGKPPAPCFDRASIVLHYCQFTQCVPAENPCSLISAKARFLNAVADSPPCFDIV